MRTLAAALLAILLAPAVAHADNSTTYAERRVERLLPSPFPAGVVGGAEDDYGWVVTVDPVEDTGTVVQVRANSSGSSIFFFRYGPVDGSESGSLLPTATQTILLGRGAWRVDVDPFAGAVVDITISFAGHVGDVDGAPAAFRLADLPPGCGCVAGARLP